MLRKCYSNFFIDAGGDIEIRGTNEEGEYWRVGIADPFAGPAYNTTKPVVKVLSLTNCGLATSGTYVRGQHIYNPHNKTMQIQDIVSLTVIGPNVYEADRFATAAFAMGKKGIEFIASRPELQGYSIDSNKQALATSGFNAFVVQNT